MKATFCISLLLLGVAAAQQPEPEHEHLIVPNLTRAEAISISSNAMWSAQSPATRADTNTVTRLLWTIEPGRSGNLWGVVVPRAATNGLSIAQRQRLVVRGTSGEWVKDNLPPGAP
jgi:hypothetical protein